MKNFKAQAAKFGRQLSFRKLCIGAAGLAAGNSAFAAVDTAGVITAVDGAATSGGTVGTAVIVAVASLVVVGVVIAIVKKI